MIFRNIFLSTIALTFASCGILKTKDKGKKAEENASEIAGRWESNCFSNSIFGLAKGTRVLNFNAIGDFDRRDEFYDGSRCTTSAITYSVLGTYDVKGEADAKQGTKRINFTTNEAFLIPRTDAAATALNTLKHCGIDDWHASHAVKVSGRDCGSFTVRKGDVTQDVYKLQDGKLYLGNAFALSTRRSSERPSKVDDDVSYDRK